MSIHNHPGRDLCSLVLGAVQTGSLPTVGRNIAAVHAAHRIDRDTSGLVLLSGDPETLGSFGGQFAARTVLKRYLAVVHGNLGSPKASDWFDWTWPLGAAAAGRNNPAGRGKRMPSATRWRLLDHSPHYSLIECEPLTGRKHQIRRHAKLAGHPIVGDRRYGSSRSLAFLSRQRAFNRLGLHAHMISIRLPGETDTTTFHSAGLPQPMQQLIETDR
jgi:23S rRNA-/tRNA-specific pseudouridylate synthase